MTCSHKDVVVPEPQNHQEKLINENTSSPNFTTFVQSMITKISIFIELVSLRILNFIEFSFLIQRFFWSISSVNCHILATHK